VQVNNQRRKVESLFDDISLHWRQLKPLHGVRSRMFASELLAFLLAPVLSILDFLASTFSFGLLFFFLLLGPVALFFGMFAFSLGMAMLPMIGSCLVILYTLEFPWLIIQVLAVCGLACACVCVCGSHYMWAPTVQSVGAGVRGGLRALRAGDLLAGQEHEPHPPPRAPVPLRSRHRRTTWPPNNPPGSSPCHRCSLVRHRHRAPTYGQRQDRLMLLQTVPAMNLASEREKREESVFWCTTLLYYWV
jgi:hypothetical protein